MTPRKFRNAVAGASSSTEKGGSPLSTPDGIAPFINAKADLPMKQDFAVNSWFAIGHFQAEGHLLDYLYHVMIFPSPDGKPILQSVVSITDETTGWFQGTDIILPFKENGASKFGIDFAVPNGEMRGTLDDLTVKASLPDGAVNLHLQATSSTIYNGGTGVFPLLTMTIHQYSVPRLASKGTITIKGKTYSVDGVSWFDRQWQNPPAAGAPPLKWSWMDLNLDNGDAVSLWSAMDPDTSKQRAWATVLHKDGTQTITAIDPGLGASDEWVSEKSGNRYPTHWTVRIPSLRAVLDVKPSPREQEIISHIPAMTKYEGASAVTGTYNGKPVKGHCYVELVGFGSDPLT